MLGRLGFALYVLSLIIGGPLIALLIWGWFTGHIDPSGQAVLGVIGTAVILIGRSLQYILSGH